MIEKCKTHLGSFRLASKLSSLRLRPQSHGHGCHPKGRSAPWRHTLEGPDDMPAHIKSSMFGCALAVPITNGA